MRRAWPAAGLAVLVGLAWLALPRAELVGLAWLALPRAELGAVPEFDAAVLEDGVAPYLAQREARFDDIVPGTEKRVVWAGAAGEPTDWAVLYVQGFVASSEEIRPVPDRVAAALGANLVFTRLTGHGRDGAALRGIAAADWMADMAEALAVAGRVGARVAVIATSTGGTLTAIAAADPDLGADLDAAVLISPNFGPQAARAGLLTWPGARWWAPLIAGETRSFTPVNDAHARFWTETYPLEATVPMQALVAAAREADLGAATAPALVIYSDVDRVVRPEAVRGTMERWGAPVRMRRIEAAGEGVDPMHHVLAGDILSPALTAPVADEIAAFLSEL